MQDLPEIPTLKKLLQELNDPTLLQQSRGYSNFYDYSIVRWVNRRSGLIYRNSMDHNCASAEIELPQGPKTPKVFVPAINPDVLLACLTLSDVRELAHFEEPSMASSEQIGTRIQREVEIAPGSLPRDLLLATVFAQVLLFFVLIYFAAFAVEGALIDGFPAPGTLFSAFARSRFTLVSLVLAFLSPFAASLAVAISARVPWLGICSILIICPAFQAYAALQRKAYFRPLNPRGWMPKAAIATEPPSGQNEPKS